MIDIRDEGPRFAHEQVGQAVAIEIGEGYVLVRRRAPREESS